MTSTKRLGIAFIGAGFMNTFHTKSWTSVRDSQIVAICSPNLHHARTLADLCRDHNIGTPKCFTDVSETVRDPDVDAAWIAVPNDLHLPITQTIAEEKMQGKSNIRAIACEKPLSLDVSQAKEMIRLAEKADLLHGYLENQVYAPSLVKGKEVIWSHSGQAGRPYLARASEEHSGPHEPWFWQTDRSGGGALMDMMCHTLEATRYLLTAPNENKSDLEVKSVSAEIAHLKWTRAEYAQRLRESTHGQVDYSKNAAEDFAKASITYADKHDTVLISDNIVSWCFDGPGVRLFFELLGPEYHMQVNSLEPELHVFFGRNLKPSRGEYFVEKQGAELGLMPTIADETFTYGYQNENSHMVSSFLRNSLPTENWYDGLFIMQLITACYMSAQRGMKLKYPPAGLDDYKHIHASKNPSF